MVLQYDEDDSKDYSHTMTVPTIRNNSKKKKDY